MKFTWIHENCGVFEVRRMCRVLGRPTRTRYGPRYLSRPIRPINFSVVVINLGEICHGEN